MGNQATTVCGEDNVERWNEARYSVQWGSEDRNAGMYDTAEGGAGYHASHPSRDRLAHGGVSDRRQGQLGQQGLSVDEVSVGAGTGAGSSRGWETDAGRGVGFMEHGEDDTEAEEGFGQEGSGFGDVAVAAAARLPKSFFDLEVGEGPILKDERLMHLRERIQHRFRSGAFYDGEWLNGNRDGIGRMEWLDGTEYVGEWERGRANGLGRLLHRDGDIYHGQWVNGRAHGLGSYDFQNGAATYRGEFRCDLRDGFGIESWADGSCYEGEYRRGEKSGFGQTRWPDGSYYVGRWRSNQLCGPGSLKTKDGLHYKGQWDMSSPNGMGVYKWPSGRRYEGRYLNDRKHGYGILREPNKPEVRGFWQHGELVSTRASGLK
eukprot:CAMPEP_0170227400 /NCGR_PEP_ID=MMETSP0116_2-20130129/13414_1 /TAXON_ID=400756 /ORGANISM="Durinskia baltica, Strain CSIRO CS-38" /LENGTH=374 /DNA_ID=CAMNT_0010478131 /DNA_START=62 /DNA_END=1186 /DNA_ORIENTATION=-